MRSSLPAVLAAAALVMVACGTLPKAPPHSVAPPSYAALPASPAVDVCWLEFLTAKGPAGPATAGWTHTSEFNGTISGLLVKHPKGNILIDAGNSSHYWDEIKGYSMLRRFYLGQTSGRAKRKAMPIDALAAAGVTPAQLLFVILSHGHIDHAGGMVDLPGVRALMSKEEWDFMREAGPKKTISVIPAHEETLEGRVDTIEWKPVPYETFDESADLFGDGSVVLVKLFGN